MPNFQGELSGLIDILRPGDIFCHVYTPQKGILEDGSVSEEMKRAFKKALSWNLHAEKDILDTNAQEKLFRQGLSQINFRRFYKKHPSF